MAQDDNIDQDAPAARWRAGDGPHPQGWEESSKEASEWGESQKSVSEWSCPLDESN